MMHNSQRFITGDIWKIANKEMPEKGKEAAIAYVTSSKLKLTKGDTLICNASNYAITNGQTDAKVLKYYFDKGVNIYSNRFIHCKILLSNNSIIVGSANLSFSSAEKLTESAIISDDKAIISGAKSFILNIVEDISNTKNLKDGDIEKLLSIPVLRRPYNPRFCIRN